MTVRNEEIDDIDLRLELIKEKYDGKVPPQQQLVSASVKSGQARTNNNTTPADPMTAVPGDKPFLKAGTIKAPKQKRDLMRQVSALGMEDPVFGTVEEAPRHPSNIFDDMSLGDIPQDMRDLISVASDPTADVDEGIDANMYQTSLAAGDLHHQAEPPKFNMELSFAPKNSGGKAPKARKSSLLGENDEGSDASSISFDLDFPPVVKPSSSSPKGNQQESSHSTTKNSYSKNHKERSPAGAGGPPVHVRKISASAHFLQNSIPSLGFDNPAADAPTSPTSPAAGGDDVQKSMLSVESSTSKTSHTSGSGNKMEISMDKMAERLAPRKSKSSGNKDGSKDSNHSKNAAGSNLASSHKNRTNARAPIRQVSNKKDTLSCKDTTPATTLMNNPALQASYSSCLDRGDSIHQPVTRGKSRDKMSSKQQKQQLKEMQKQQKIEQQKEQNSDKNHVPPTAAGKSSNSANGGDSTPMTKSRVMPTFNSLFPTTAGTNNVTKRMRARRQRVPPTQTTNV